MLYVICQMGAFFFSLLHFNGFGIIIVIILEVVASYFP